MSQSIAHFGFQAENGRVSQYNGDQIMEHPSHDWQPSKEDEPQTMPATYSELLDMTPEERYQLASHSYHQLAAADPELIGSPAYMAQQISSETGVDFETAVAVALSAAR